MNNILIYGGSFDPPHLGHIKTASAVQKKFNFDTFFFVPCKQPVLKSKSIASSAQRLDMLKLALTSYSQFEFQIDTRELDRDTPSFMLDTLTSFQEEYKNKASITLLLGMDAFLELPRWHQWKKILTCCDLLVMQRAGEDQNKTISRELEAALHASSCQLIFLKPVIILLPQVHCVSVLRLAKNSKATYSQKLCMTILRLIICIKHARARF